MDSERESFSWSLFVVGVSFKLGRNCQMDFRCDWFLALNFIPLSSLVIYLFLTFSTTSLSLTSSAPIKLLIWNLPPVIQDEWLMPSSPSSLWFLSWSLEFTLPSMDNPVTRIKLHHAHRIDISTMCATSRSHYSVSTPVSVKPLDMFDETLGRFPANQVSQNIFFFWP